MKFLFGIDVTQSDENCSYDGKEFMVQQTSKTQAEALESASQESIEHMLGYKAPFYVRFGEIVSAFAVIVSFIVGITMLENMAIADAYQKAPWIFYVFGIGIVLVVAFTVIDVKTWKKAMESEDNTYLISKVETITQNIYNELGVPADAQEAEILSVRYAYGYNDEIVLKKHKYRGTVIGPEYENHVYKLFVRENTLFIADTEGKYAVPFSEMKAIRTINKKIDIDSWLKDEPYNKGQYKEYKIRENDEGNITIKPYHILEIEHSGEVWGMYFPCYELPVIEKLTGLKAE